VPHPSRPVSASGQASVELVALLPLLALVLALAWQGVLAGQALWSAAAAAHAAARAAAVGAPPVPAARAALPASLERGLRVTQPTPDSVAVRVRIPSALAGLRLGTTTATAHFPPQA
jgi:hypothetical protein